MLSSGVAGRALVESKDKGEHEEAGGGRQRSWVRAVRSPSHAVLTTEAPRGRDTAQGPWTPTDGWGLTRTGGV